MDFRQFMPWKIGLMLVACASVAVGQSYEPPWRPVGSARVTTGYGPAQGNPAAQPVQQQAANAWSPYYNESPLFQPGGIMYRGQTTYPQYQQRVPVQAVPQRVAPAPTSTIPAAPTGVVQTPVQPAQPVQPIQPAQPTPQPNIQTPQVQPPQSPAAGIAQSQPADPPAGQTPDPAAAGQNQTPEAAAGAPAVAAAQSAPDAPFEDNRVFVGRGRQWVEIPISTYTSRFHASSNPEAGVKEWIDRMTANVDWSGPDTSSLTVSSQWVKVYHDPQVQDEVINLLGRFTNYSPGKFNCRITLVNVESAKWMRRFQGQLQLVSEANERRTWVMNNAAAEQFLSEMRNGSGALVLTSEAFPVANGQKAQVTWVKDPQLAAEGAQGAKNVDGVSLEFSPLIAPDAASVDVAVDLAVRSTAKSSTVFRTTYDDGRNMPSNARSVDLSNLVRIPPGKHLLIGLDGVPTFDPKERWFNRNRQAAVLALISVVPDPSNMVLGVPNEEPQLAQTSGSAQGNVYQAYSQQRGDAETAAPAPPTNPLEQPSAVAASPPAPPRRSLRERFPLSGLAPSF
jgi:hypothetical protein